MSSRHGGLLPQGGQRALAEACVAVTGLGGVGGVAAEKLVRAGVGRLRLAEMDHFARSNLNRQFGAYEETLGQPKLDVQAQLFRGINPDLRLDLHPEGVTEENCERLVCGVNALVLCHDHGPTTATLVHACKRAGVPIVSPRTSGWQASCFIVTPDGESVLDYHRFCGLPERVELTYFTNWSIGVSAALAGILAASTALQLIVWDELPYAPFPTVYQMDLRTLSAHTYDIYARTKALRALERDVTALATLPSEEGVRNLAVRRGLRLTEEEVAYLRWRRGLVRRPPAERRMARRRDDRVQVALRQTAS